MADMVGEAKMIGRCPLDQIMASTVEQVGLVLILGTIRLRRFVLRPFFVRLVRGIGMGLVA